MFNQSHDTWSKNTQRIKAMQILVGVTERRRASTNEKTTFKSAMKRKAGNWKR